MASSGTFDLSLHAAAVLTPFDSEPGFVDFPQECLVMVVPGSEISGKYRLTDLLPGESQFFKGADLSLVRDSWYGIRKRHQEKYAGWVLEFARSQNGVIVRRIR